MFNLKIDWWQRCLNLLTIANVNSSQSNNRGGLIRSMALASLIGATFFGVGTTKVLAAERITVQVGPLEQSINVDEIEEFAQTGKLSARLQPYASFLNPRLRQILSGRLQIDPNVADKFIENFFRSAQGNEIIKKIALAIPNSTVEQLQGALSVAARQANGLSVVSFLRAYPGENITVDASAALSLTLQINPAFLQSQALSSLLEEELLDKNNSFRPSLDPANTGDRTVQIQTLNLEDRQRNRNIPVDLYWANNTNGPLVVISPGFGSDRTQLAYLARHLASHGLTVAALEHPGSNAAKLAGTTISTKPGDLIAASEFADRPKDISFLLDRLEEINQQSGPLQGKLNTQQVSVLGHSLGGYTALAIAGGELNLEELRQFCAQGTFSQLGGDWLQCAATNLPGQRLQVGDRRVRQAIALNPVVGSLFGKNGLNKVTIPTLVLSSTNDVFTPAVSHQLRPFIQLAGSKYLITAIGATHLSASDPKNLNPALARNNVVLERTGKEVESLRRLLQGSTLAFIKQQTSEASTYKPFLTSQYAQSLSTKTLPLRLNSSIPSSVTTWLNIP